MSANLPDQIADLLLALANVRAELGPEMYLGAVRPIVVAHMQRAYELGKKGATGQGDLFGRPRPRDPG